MTTSIDKWLAEQKEICGKYPVNSRTPLIRLMQLSESVPILLDLIAEYRKVLVKVEVWSRCCGNEWNVQQSMGDAAREALAFKPKGMK